MTYDTRKSLRGQEFVQEVEMVLDCCKYTLAPYINDRTLYSDRLATVAIGATGFSIVLGSQSGTTWDTTWPISGTMYGLTSRDEIISFTYIDVTHILLTGRALFGSVGATIQRFDRIRIMHSGEADNTCRGFPKDCSDADSYSSDAKLRLVFCTGQNAGGVRRFPGLRKDKIFHDSGEVDPGETIGARSKLKVGISNQINNDYGIVPYVSKQTSNGTLFGKLLARHPYFQGRELIYREGLRDTNTYSGPDYIERKFIIDEVNLDNGVFTISALDPLILTEDKKAQMPIASPATLTAAMNSGTTAFSYSNAPNYYFGAMAAVIYIRIDSEVIACTVTGATQLTVTQRAYKSAQKDHSANASIQDCVVFTGTHGINAIVYAIENFTTINPSFVGDYSSAIASLPSFVLSEMVISKPIAVIDFINSLIKLGNLLVDYNEQTQKIVIEYTPELEIEPISIDQSMHIKRDSVQIDNNFKNQYTRFAYLFAPVDITQDKEENFAIRFLSANLPLESAEYMNEVNEKKTIKNQFLTDSPGDALLATSYVGRVLENNDITPKVISCVIDASVVGPAQGGELKKGSIVNLTTKYNEDKDGNPISDLYQVLKISGNAYDGFKTKFRRYQATIPSSISFTISVGGINYDLSDYFAPAAGSYTVYISPGVEFGSYDAAIPAFTTGTQAVGVSFNIIHRGKILGMGGIGGDAGKSGLPETDGEPGGIAFEATVDCVIDCGSGLIWAGGGGAGGNLYISPQGPFSSPVSSRGGGGAQGYGAAIGGKNTDGIDFDGTRAASGNQSGPGAEFYTGGAWGENGESYDGGLSGGIAGEAIKSNGNSVTLSSGDNDLNIRGRRT